MVRIGAEGDMNKERRDFSVAGNIGQPAVNSGSWSRNI
jgi:hypothetical protein